MDNPKITIYKNGDVSQEVKITLYPHLTLKDLIRDAMDAFEIPSSTRCMLFEA
jgi:hypothetical protein